MSTQAILVYGPHVALGLAALLLFWRALLARKGSAVHRRFGRLYLLVVAPLVASVVPISFTAFSEKGPAAVLQLVYLSVVFATAGWTAWHAIRDRADLDAFRGRIFAILAGLMVGLGSLLLAVGIARHDVLATGFSVIGLVYGGAMLGLLKARPHSGWWLEWHLNGVCLLFAATHASFLRLVLRTLLPAWDGETMHFGAQLGTIAFAYLLRQWMRWRYQTGRVRDVEHSPARSSRDRTSYAAVSGAG